MAADATGTTPSRDTIEVLDAQVHLFEANGPRFPWSPAVLHDPVYAGMRGRFSASSATPSEVLATFDENDVAGALVVTPSIYGFDNSYSTDACAVAPDRFRVVGLVDSSRPDVAEVVGTWAADPAFVGIRLGLWQDDAVGRFFEGAEDRVFAAAQRHGLCVCVNSPGRFEVFERIARTFPDLQLVIDHLGLFSVGMLDPAVRDTFALIGGLLPLAAYENVAVKITSLPLLSREQYPFPDVWPHLVAVAEAFGVERLMWGSDGFLFGHPYTHTLDFLRASDRFGTRDKQMLLGGALRRIWRWPSTAVETDRA